MKGGVCILGRCLGRSASHHGSQSLKFSRAAKSRLLPLGGSQVCSPTVCLGDGLRHVMGFCRLVQLGNKNIKKGLSWRKKLIPPGDEESLGNIWVMEILYLLGRKPDPVFRVGLEGVKE